MMPAKKHGPDLTLVFGMGPKSGKGEPDKAEAEENEETAIPPDFEKAAVEAFPELEGDEERIAALHRACLAAQGE